MSTPSNLVAGTIETLEAANAILRAMLLRLPEERLENRGAEGWSPRDVVVHLAARQRAALEGRLRQMLDEECPRLPDIPHDRMVARYPLATQPIAIILNDHAAARREALELVRALTPGQFARTGTLAVGTVSVSEVIHHVAFHDLVHIAQINALISDPIERARGAMRAFR